MSRPRPTYRPRPSLATATFKVGMSFPAVGAQLIQGWVSS